MSHFKERKESNCLNCNAQVHDRFCGICGQENIEPKESAWHLMQHFFEDITHFDGKFFSSLKYLITKPGFLSTEYIRGRRQAYLNPVRFYIFTSFIFFLILFTFFVKGDSFIKYNKEEDQKNKVVKKKSKENFHISFFDFKDSVNRKTQKGKKESSDLKSKTDNIENLKNNPLTFTDFKNREEYDSLEKAGKLQVTWFRKKLALKQFDLNEKFDNDKEKILHYFFETLSHNIPQVLFFTLPFFALCLKLIYIRRKNFYYVSHLIFTLHFYIFVYVNLFFINLLGALAEYFSIGFLYDLNIILTLGLPFYLYKAIRNFYQQSRVKTIFKLFTLSFLLIFVFILFVFLLFLVSLYKM